MQTNLHYLIKLHQQIQFFRSVPSYNVQNEHRVSLTHIYIKSHTKSLETNWYFKTVIFGGITCKTLLESTALDLKNFS